jgi:hypothetical protein
MDIEPQMAERCKTSIWTPPIFLMYLLIVLTTFISRAVLGFFLKEGFKFLYCFTMRAYQKNFPPLTIADIIALGLERLIMPSELQVHAVSTTSHPSSPTADTGTVDMAISPSTTRKRMVSACTKPSERENTVDAKINPTNTKKSIAPNSAYFTSVDICIRTGASTTSATYKSSFPLVVAVVPRPCTYT